MSEQPADGGFHAEVNSKIEPIIVAHICQPLLDRLPRSVNPNTISLCTSVICWAVALTAASAPGLRQPWQALALVFAGVGMFATMVGDCLDGMQARRTDRCTKLGEMMDHWLDAIHIPLVPFGLTLALQLEPWAMAAVMISTVMVYNAQLVLYHHTRHFVHPPTSGPETQFGISLGYVGAAIGFAFVPRATRWLDVALRAVGVAATLVNLRQCVFYYPRYQPRGRLLREHLSFVLLCLGAAALFLVGAMSAFTFGLAITLLSFRVTGSYVLHTIVREPYDGLDGGSLIWLAALGAAALLTGRLPFGHAAALLAGPLRLGSLTVTPGDVVPYLPYVWFAYLVGRNVVDFVRHYDQLRPPPWVDRG